MQDFDRQLKIAYLAGPMFGHKDLNFPFFHAVAARWRGAGYAVFNPAESFGGRQDLELIDYYRVGLVNVLSSHFLILLPDWQKSKGSNLEKTIAEHVGIPIV